MSTELSLEAITAEIANLTPSEPEPGVTAHVKFEKNKFAGAVRGAVSYATRFGEVVKVFLEEGTVAGVSRQTGISDYTLRRHYFGNPEFCELLKKASSTIFLEATKSIRDNQTTMIEKAQRLAQDALDEMERLLNDSESEHIRFKVAQDLLDRDPRISRTKRIESTGVNITIEQKTIAMAIEAAGELEARDITPLGATSNTTTLNVQQAHSQVPETVKEALKEID